MKLTVMFTCVVLIMSLFSAALPVNGEVEIFDNVVRLHVVANSDSVQDQQIKLKIRDAVLNDMESFMSAAATVDEAKSIIGENAERIRRVAEGCLRDYGFDYGCDVVCGEEYYPQREYDGVNLPAGRYYSLRVNAGDAAGKNWWCVLFPQLCLGCAEATDELAEVGFTPEEVGILCETDEPEYTLKFRFLEFFDKIFA